MQWTCSTAVRDTSDAFKKEKVETEVIKRKYIPVYQCYFCITKKWVLWKMNIFNVHATRKKKRKKEEKKRKKKQKHNKILLIKKKKKKQAQQKRVCAALQYLDAQERKEKKERKEKQQQQLVHWSNQKQRYEKLPEIWAEGKTQMYDFAENGLTPHWPRACKHVLHIKLVLHSHYKWCTQLLVT